MSLKLGVLGVSPAAITDRAGGPGLEVDLDDTALSIGLADRLRSDCARDEHCAVWVEGTWGRLIEVPTLGVGPRRSAFTVRRYLGLVEGSAPRILVLSTAP